MVWKYDMERSKTLGLSGQSFRGFLKVFVVQFSGWRTQGVGGQSIKRT